ncbi:MAG: hypothetical protein JSR46_10450 [Verrucomicrobia bacterium]|nr:hypothetical protein [Verrucomicrobiota bacterium]
MTFILPIMEQFASSISSSRDVGAIPWPFNHITQGLSLAHAGSFAIDQLSENNKNVSLSTLALHHVINQQPFIPELARAILIARRALSVFQQANQVKKVQNSLISVVSGSFPVPVRLLRETKTPHTEFLDTVPQFFSEFLLTAQQAMRNIEQLFHATVSCGRACLEFAFSLNPDKITQFEANATCASNIDTICDELKKDPKKLSREIEANAETLDSILPSINPRWTAKNLSAWITQGVETVVEVHKVAKTTLELFVETVQQCAFILSSITVGSSTPPLGVGTVPKEYTQGPIHQYYEIGKGKAK